MLELRYRERSAQLNTVLVHFGFGRVASLEFSPAFERWAQGHFDFPSRNDEWTIARASLTRRSRFTVFPGFEKPAKFKGRYASKSKMNQYP
jgi:hypothetical protein